MKAKSAALKLLVFALAVGLGMFALLRSNWFSEYLRRITIHTIQNATGGRAELRRFRFNSNSLTVGLDGLTIHGTEPAGSTPLFYASHIQIGLAFSSLFSRGIRLSSVEADNPALHILESSDGTTNIPIFSPSSGPSPLSRVFRLRISRTAIRGGSAQFNSHRIPLNLNADDLNLFLNYHGRPSRYDVTLHLGEVSFKSAGQFAMRAGVDLAGQLTQEHFAVTTFHLQSGASQISLSGVVRHFEQPSVDLSASAAMEGTDIARLARLPWLNSGTVAIAGQFHYDQAAAFTFTGRASGQNLGYHLYGVNLSGASFRSDLFAAPELIDLPNLKLTALNGEVIGDLRFLNLNRMAFRGSVERIDMQRFLQLILPKAPPYSAAVTGPVTLDTRITRTLQDTRIGASVELAPLLGSTPVSGHILVDYNQQLQNTVTFGASEVIFSKSRVLLSGTLDSSLELHATTHSLSDLSPTFDWIGLDVPQWFTLSSQTAEGRFDGKLLGSTADPSVNGTVELHNFSVQGHRMDSARLEGLVSRAHLSLQSFSLDNSVIHLSGEASASLTDWAFARAGNLGVRATMRTPNLGAAAKLISTRSTSVDGGTGLVSLNLSGSMQQLLGGAGINIRDVWIFGEHIDKLHAALSFSGNEVRVDKADVQSGSASATLICSYFHRIGSWLNGSLHTRVDTNRFPLDELHAVRHTVQGVTARSELHAEGDFKVNQGRLDPIAANRTLALKDITVNSLRRGNLTLNAATEGDLLTLGLAGNLEGSPVSGNLRTHLMTDYRTAGELRFGKLSLLTVLALANPVGKAPPPLEGSLRGRVRMAGPLLHPEQITSEIELNDLELRAESTQLLPGGLQSDQFIMRNIGPIKIDTAGSTASIRQFRAATRNTEASLTGRVDVATLSLNLKSEGSIDLRLLELVDSDVQSAGIAKLSVNITGTTEHPLIDGSMELKHGSLYLPTMTNGLSDINGSVRFTRDRAFVQNAVAQTGGGDVRLSGVISYGEKGPLIYDLEAEANRVRFRYLRASVTGDAVLRMTGTSQNGLLSGSIAVSRIVFEPGADLANVLAGAAAPTATPVNDKDFIAGVTLDVHIQSAPNLQVVTSLSQDVQADIDLRLRGTRDRPVLLGHISANQGELTIFGTKYGISRGNISFVNTVRIEPVLDLDLQTETRGITVDVIVSGTLSKLGMSYRSDPPLQAKEIIALLTVGQAPSFAGGNTNTRAQSDTTALQAGANTVLGQAISPASNRLSKLFGITNIRIDPLVQNLTNTPQARLTLEQQISRDITVTYITNLAQTSEQIFRFEWAFTRQYSLVAVRDDNGEFGIDIQFKKRFK